MKARTWVSALMHGTWADDPYVLLYLIPRDAATNVMRNATREVELIVVELNGRRRGLQALSPRASSYPAQLAIFDRFNIEPADHAWFGRLSDVPQEYLLNEELAPVVIQRDSMWLPFINLRSAFGSNFDEKNAN